MIPAPETTREEIQNEAIRASEVDPSEYYPEGYQPEMLTKWPVAGPFVVPIDKLPPALLNTMGENWQHREAYAAEMERRAAESDD